MSKLAKKILSILLPIDRNTKVKLTSHNILSIVNRIPLPASQLKRPNIVDQFIEEEINEYPVTKKVVKFSRREQIIQIKLKDNMSISLINEFFGLYLKLEKRLTYLQLQQLLDLLPKFSIKQKLKYMMNFRVLSRRINYKVQSQNLSEHVIDAAKKVIKEINSMTSKKLDMLI